MKTIEQSMADVVRYVWINSVTVQSNYARETAAMIAACASEGLLTTKVGGNIYVSQWLPTPAGLEFLQDQLGELIF